MIVAGHGERRGKGPVHASGENLAPRCDGDAIDQLGVVFQLVRVNILFEELHQTDHRVFFKCFKEFFSFFGILIVIILLLHVD